MVTRRRFLVNASLAVGGAGFLSLLPRQLVARSLPSIISHTTSAIPSVHRSFYTMGTVVSITAFGSDIRGVHHAINRANDEFRRLDAALSVFKHSSVVSRINRAAGRRHVAVDGELMMLLGQAARHASLTHGAFDITVEPLMSLWGFRSQTIPHRYPTDREILRVLDAVGMDKIQRDERDAMIALLHEETRIDLGGIAVGYAVDRAVSVLREEGITSAFINHSGDAFALGAPPDQEGWNVSIPNPLRPKEMLVYLTLRDRAISTSGAYEKFIPIEGQKCGHILDPRTGRPGSGMLSSSVLAPSALDADALSTGMFCMQPAEAERLVRNLNGVELIAMVDSGDGAEIRRSG